MSLMQQNTASPERLSQFLIRATDSATDRYLHWDELRQRPAPHGLTHEEWWAAEKIRRNASAQVIPLRDASQKPFRYSLAMPIQELLHRIDMNAGGRVGMPVQITNPETRDQYYVASLIEEAITSSQLEGASTTRQGREGDDPAPGAPLPTAASASSSTTTARCRRFAAIRMRRCPRTSYSRFNIR